MTTNVNMQKSPQGDFALKLARNSRYIDLMDSAESLLKDRRVFTIFAWQQNDKWLNESSRPHGNYTSQFDDLQYAYIPWVHFNGRKFHATNKYVGAWSKNPAYMKNLMFSAHRFFKDEEELRNWFGEHFHLMVADLL